VAYLFPATVVLTVNGRAVCCVTNPLQDCCFSRICSSYDEDSELDVWNRVGLFRIHWIDIRWRDGARASLREGVIGTHCWTDGAREGVIGIRWRDGTRSTAGLIGTHCLMICVGPGQEALSSDAANLRSRAHVLRLRRSSANRPYISLVCRLSFSPLTLASH